MRVVSSGTPELARSLLHPKPAFEENQVRPDSQRYAVGRDYMEEIREPTQTILLPTLRSSCAEKAMNSTVVSQTKWPKA